MERSIARMAPASALCDRCALDMNPSDGQIGSKRPFIRDVINTAARGCPVCALFREAVSQNNSLWYSESTPTSEQADKHGVHGIHIVGSRDYGLEARVEIIGLVNPFKLRFFQVNKPNSANGPARSPEPFNTLSKCLPTEAILPEGTHSEESLLWIKQQIHTCETAHSSDSFYDTITSTFPTRVVDVSEGTVRLWEPTQEVDAKSPYLALSYCWGKEPFLRTTSRNIDAHKAGIAWDSLPRTFQDAIDMTRRLEHRFLWIDSLCIIQDDDADWKKESSRMASVFESAFLVLSAARSGSAHEGMHTAPLSMQCRGLEFIHRSGRASNVFFRPIILHIDDEWNSDRFPTVHRGWIFQERLLAKRIIHFGPEELTWECSRGQKCQCRGEKDWIRGRGSGLVAPVDKAGYRANWQLMIENYMQMQLTYEKDIFPAISGLAKRFQTALQSRYMAGIWLDTFPESLLWHDVPPFGHFKDGIQQHEPLPGVDRRPVRWRAPSWSWASLRGAELLHQDFRTNHLDNPVTMFATILNTFCQQAGPDPAGELVPWGSYLALRGKLIPATLKLNPRIGNIGQHHSLSCFNSSQHEYDLSLDDEFYLRQIYFKNARADLGRTLLGKPMQKCDRYSFRVRCMLLAQYGRSLYFYVLRKIDEEEGRLIEAAAKLHSTGVEDQATSQNRYVRIGLVQVEDGRGEGWEEELAKKGAETVIAIY